MNFKTSLKNSAIVLLLFPFFSLQNSYAENQPLKIDSQTIKNIPASEFEEGIKELRNQGFKEIIVESESSPFEKVTAQKAGSSGDFYIMLGLEKTENDNTIRAIDYYNLQSIVSHMSEMKFRVIMNLYAGISDLKSALNADRPTVILWASHGTAVNFYSATGEPVPASVFKDASPYVYQFILSACYGTEAFDFKYGPVVPKTMKTYTWSGETKPSELKKWIYSGAWSAFSNRKEITNEGLICERQGSGYTLKNKALKKSLPGYTYSSANACHESLLKANNGFACNQVGPIDFTTISIAKLQVTDGSKYSSQDECMNRLKSAYNGKICRGLPGSNKVLMIDSRTNTANERYFTAMPDCVNTLFSEREL